MAKAFGFLLQSPLPLQDYQKSKAAQKLARCLEQDSSFAVALHPPARGLLSGMVQIMRLPNETYYYPRADPHPPFWRTSPRFADSQ